MSDNVRKQIDGEYTVLLDEDGKFTWPLPTQFDAIQHDTATFHSSTLKYQSAGENPKQLHDLMDAEGRWAKTDMADYQKEVRFADQQGWCRSSNGNGFLVRLG